MSEMTPKTPEAPTSGATEGAGEAPLGRLEPLLLRPGAAYTCFGDGLCCADMHVIGPVSSKERQRLALLSDEAVRWAEHAECHVLVMRADTGTCFFNGEDGLCAIHEPMDGMLKPRVCHRFPFVLTGTPEGGRVSLEHRCSCQTFGAPGPLDEATAERALRGEAGGLRPNHRVGDAVPLREGETVSFAAYRAIEEPLLARLEAGEDPRAVLDRAPFPALSEGSWGGFGEAMLDAAGETRFEMALRAVGAVIVAREGGEPEAWGRPWTPAFDRAEARVAEPIDPGPAYARWAVDAIWSLMWTGYGTLEKVRRELCTRLAIADDLRDALVEQGVRGDRAAAEALTVVDLVGTSDWWEGAVKRMAETD
ncbi:MAG TPA: YkgJ family cysteine cluster protein [Polyangiaceae bacterium LLY-WYZ-15_(1-7)]|nr:hypothetical protein [Sandaracinus sp.]HJL04839.1 YkgJ family cysteine cluster protein [Polyangiaceae bacterium LLY-WYZ-15_(1-7)]MBJ72474.1 hypothetical protein [Sandaracinus sp.]HJL13240.1 YkgJ family cysteine cluster protein [Polyangiaceae bacterium LLY-WYZ-15_(1-7)]HJL28813.1 YkgJ family cysteine cluster protein [Polyangiaceae bacterium LLY-WYZ-15_(1-7)]